MGPSNGTNRDAGRTGVVLLSGGLDSATTLAMARADGFACHALAFDYGQRHRHELLAARELAGHLGAASFRVFPLDIGAFGGSALTDPTIAVPKDGPGAGVPVTYVPARNLVFLAVATALGESLGSGDLFIGVNAVDFSGYPDCRPAFIGAFGRAANLATRVGTEGAGVRVHAPLIGMGKHEIIRTGVALGVDYGMTHSCYEPIERGGVALACARCDSCRLRAKGFADAGVPDPTRYA